MFFAMYSVHALPERAGLISSQGWVYADFNKLDCFCVPEYETEKEVVHITRAYPCAWRDVVEWFNGETYIPQYLDTYVHTHASKVGHHVIAQFM